VIAASAPFHEAVYEAIRDRDPDRAYEAMRAHHESGQQFYGKDLDLSLDVVARRELERLLGPTASLEQIIGDVMANASAAEVAATAADGAPAKPAAKPRTRAAKA
jgi:hypothetical protein